jgi:hypothetical protein
MTSNPIAQTIRGIFRAVRARPAIVLGVTALVAVFNLVAPVAILSIAKRPPDFITFNPYLARLPEYLKSDVPLGNKLSFLSHMAIGWVSADNGGEGIDWGFLVDVPTVGRILLTSVIFGTFFALWSYWNREGQACGLAFKAARPAGMAGAVTSVVGLTTGPCTLSGCGVPVLPVVGLAFTGLESSTLRLFTNLSIVSIAVVLTAMAGAVLWLGWRVGGLPPPTGSE